jgi:hypothetical protein
MDAVKEPIAATRNPDVLQTLQEMVIVGVAAYLDDFLNCMVGLASAHREREFRDFLAAHGDDPERAASQSCSLGELMRFARRRVTFKERGKKLAGICQLLLDAAPWPDEETRRYVCDLVRVRNIVVHHGGWPGEEHAKDVETAGVIVPSNDIFWKLELRAFIGPAFAAAAVVGVTLTDAAERHPKLRL